MENSKTSSLSSGLLWFGAAVSIAEILTGTLIAPLGFGKGLVAVIIGHVIGCVLLYFAGLIGGKTGKSAMETVKISFGQKGSLLFSSLNVLQLVGWTGIMVFSAATAASSVANIGGDWVWCLVIGALIIAWVLIGIKNLGKVNLFAMAALFILSVVLSTLAFGGQAPSAFQGSIRFGSAVELSAAMPLSWLPLISDYTRSAKKPREATLVSSAVYFLVSCWMYAIGLGAAIFTGESDIAKIMVRMGLGAAALVIIVFSTVTTTFLDVYSAGVSSLSICPRWKEKPVAVIVCVVGVLLAIFTPISRFESFLYLIGSVFAPMIAILITDYFILKKDHSEKSVHWQNLLLWCVGFGIYRVLLRFELPMGSTLPVMVITAVLCILVNKLSGGKTHAERDAH